MTVRRRGWTGGKGHSEKGGGGGVGEERQLGSGRARHHDKNDVDPLYSLQQEQRQSVITIALAN